MSSTQQSSFFCNGLASNIHDRRLRNSFRCSSRQRCAPVRDLCLEEQCNEKKNWNFWGFKDRIVGLQNGSVKGELVFLALPAIFGQAVEPLAQLMETAYIGRLGIGGGSDLNKSYSDERAERKQLPSVSTALLLATGIGTVEALALFFGSGFFLNLMGISPVRNPSLFYLKHIEASPMRHPSQRFLSLRALGAPAVVVSLAVQGLGNVSAVVLLPILVYSFKLGITGAAIATVASQWFAAWENYGRADYHDSRTSMAARQGPVAMAAHQICLQVWLAVSLLSDALALSGQALIASSVSKFDYRRVKEITYFVLQTGLFTGLALAVVLSTSFGSLAELFTKDIEVLQVVRSGLLFVSASQPINALAFVFDGLHYGVSDFSYAAWSMMVVGAISSTFLLCASSGWDQNQAPGGSCTRTYNLQRCSLY
ncbi:hypothetical protein QJS10_CPA01g00278 [Acorus calamus]|uniref:Protein DETOXIFICATION n=1 Tax=Acorus calamus TaxID=4465 RepID=A0AAV9FF39_ACOCL|nr:hypothetical protein QJS10_CPA01g00278 [Acorus calamus]